jgi:hypothetical protein
VSASCRGRLRAALLVAAAIALAGCDPGATISVENDTSATVIVSYVENTSSTPFSVGAGQNVFLKTILGGTNGKIYVLTPGTCAKIVSGLAIPKLGNSLIVVASDGSATVTPLDRQAVAALPGASSLPSSTCSDVLVGQ